MPPNPCQGISLEWVVLSSSAGKNGGSRQAELSQYAILAASSGDSALSRARENVLVAGFLRFKKSVNLQEVLNLP